MFFSFENKIHKKKFIDKCFDFTKAKISVDDSIK